MTNAVFTFRDGTVYDDQPEIRYHFPKKYLRLVEQAMGDLIVYYKPRRAEDRATRETYFAVARVTRIVPDETQLEHYYAYVEGGIRMGSSIAQSCRIRRDSCCGTHARFEALGKGQLGG